MRQERRISIRGKLGKKLELFREFEVDLCMPFDFWPQIAVSQTDRYTGRAIIHGWGCLPIVDGITNKGRHLINR